jgi:hypothetical protein
MIGVNAGLGNDGDRNVFLGYFAGNQEIGSDKLYIANGSTDDNVLIYGDFADGRVGIGTLSPENELHVDGTIQIGSIETVADSGAFTLATNSHWECTTDDSRRLGSSDKRWTEVWAVDGTINTSDARLKTGITELMYGLNEILDLRPVSFTWRDRPDARRRLGLIAQEVQPIMSEVVASEEIAVAEGTDGSQLTTKPAENLGIYYSQIVPVLVKAIQEQQSLIEDLTQRIEELEAGRSTR